MEDLTKIGNVPRRGQRTLRKGNKFIDTTHCVDHTRFKDSCHACLVLAVDKLVRRVEDLEQMMAINPHESSKHPQRRK